MSVYYTQTEAARKAVKSMGKRDDSEPPIGDEKQGGAQSLRFNSRDEIGWLLPCDKRRLANQPGPGLELGSCTHPPHRSLASTRITGHNSNKPNKALPTPSPGRRQQTK